MIHSKVLKNILFFIFKKSENKQKYLIQLFFSEKRPEFKIKGLKIVGIMD